MKTLTMMFVGAFFAVSLSGCFGTVMAVANKTGLTEKGADMIFSSDEEEEKEFEGEILPAVSPSSNEEVKMNES